MKRLLSFFLLLYLQCIVVNAQSWQDLLTRADSLFESVNYDSAIKTTEQALSQAEQTLGTMDTTVASILHRLGTYNLEYRQYDEAMSYFNRALTIRRQLLGSEHADVAATLYYLGAIHLRRGNYEKAEPLFQEALSIREHVYGPRHPVVARSLYGLTSLKSRLEAYTEAENLIQRAISILEGTFGLHDTSLVTPLIILGDLYHRIGRYADAAARFERAVAVSTAVLDSIHPQVARSMTGLAAVYYSMGKYAEAEPLYKQAAKAHQAKFGRYHQLVAIDLTNLGLLYAAQGKLSDAQELYRQALEIFVRSLGEHHPFVMSCHSFLAEIHLQETDYAGAESSLRKALDIAVQRFGTEHSEVAVVMNSLGDLYLSQDRLVAAESLYTAALPMLKNTVGAEHPYIVQSLNGLAVCYSRQGRYSQATEALERALSLEREVYGSSHPELARTLELSSWHHRRRKNYAASLAHAQQAVNIRRQNFSVGADVMSERDALAYAQYIRTAVDNYLSSYFDAEKTRTEDLQNVISTILQTKGQVSDGIFQRHQSVVTENDPVIVALADSLKAIKFQLSKLFVQVTGQSPKNYRDRIDSMQNLAQEIEAELARQSASFKKHQFLQDVNAASIAAALPENGVLLEYYRYDYRSLDLDSTMPRYLVVVVSRSLGSPIILELSSAFKIDQTVKRYREHLLRVSSAGTVPSNVDQFEYKRLCLGVPDEESGRHAALGLYTQIWQPLEDYVAGKDLILIAPDGALNQVSFAGLMDSDSTYLVEKYAVHYLSAGRDLIRWQDVLNPGSGLLAIGDPDFVAASTGKTSAGSTSEQSFPAPRYSSTCISALRSNLDALPATRAEIELVRSRLSQSFDEPIVTFFDSEATEENFKAQASGKRIIHLATHGFFCPSDVPDVAPVRPGTENVFVGVNPLLLSGLFFAGAAASPSQLARSQAEDGTLTAYEVSAMDLRGTELVVLSACETGLGEVQTGEGVYGLRRAFQVAGAETVISSLWPVPDQITADLMGQLYDKRDESLPEMVRRIQLSIIASLRERDAADHPFLWGAFVAVGNWR